MAQTGYFYTFTRPRTSLPMSMLKYDPISTNHLIRKRRRRGSGRRV
jgi:large subunit ribosomal protein L33